MASEGTLGCSSAVFRNKFRAGMTVRNYRDNEVVLSQRGYSRCCVLHPERHGEARGGIHASQERIVAVLPGRFFGEGSLGGQSLRISTAIKRILE
jgi:hypothetical protein